MFMSGCVKRYFLLISGLFFMGLGISLITKSSLGTPPISSIPYVLCLIYPVTFGELTFIFSLLFLLGEILLLGRNFPKNQYPQVFVGFFLGLFVDLGMLIVSSIQPAQYLWQISILLIGCVILALGIYLQVTANVIMNPGEGLVQIIAVRTKIRFGLIKIIFDSLLVTGAIIISLIHFGTLNGIREGTVISAGLVGYIIILISAMMNKINFQAWLSK
ncbi:DUF6198 family protein [uncultured Methanospirillum sp.]|uniref:YczE/YyaS/YitT family protein n=1 Tax=uncultured Methanospirillum sp. TaxID=262503 RepID=UPI0029C922A7|nr:DUF6198 family protein [uncultured Methanospirillum sp.]